MNINFKLISAFLAVAKNSSFRRAAEETNRSLPAVSMQIKQLEDQLGVPLFHRTTRRITLTQAGEKLMISARKALSELEQGLTQIQHDVDLEQGRLTFACVPTISSTRLPAILTAFVRKYPGILVNVRELANHDLLEAVRRREVDFAIGPLPERPGELHSEPLFVDEYCALLPSSYRGASNSGITLRELSKMPLLKLSSSGAFRDHVESALQENGLPVDNKYEFTHVNTLVAMAEAGLGVAILPRSALPRYTPLKAARITRPLLSRTIAVVTIRGDSLSPAAARLVSLFDSMAKVLPKTEV